MIDVRPPASGEAFLFSSTWTKSVSLVTTEAVTRGFGFQSPWRRIIELDLAVTFCEVGLATRDFVRAERNADNAPAALQAVLHAKEYLSLTDRERQAVLTKTSKAVFLLVQLERRYLRLPDKMT